MKAYAIIHEDLFCKIEECLVLFHIFSNQKAIFSCQCCNHVQHPWEKLHFWNIGTKYSSSSSYFDRQKEDDSHIKICTETGSQKTRSHKCKLCDTTAVDVREMARLFTFHCMLVPPLPGDIPSWCSDWGPWYHRSYSEYSFEH